MVSKATADFWERFNALPAERREEARAVYRRWLLEPASLQFSKKRGQAENILSVRLPSGYRACCIREEDLYVWLFIGSHAEYEAWLRAP